MAQGVEVHTVFPISQILIKQSIDCIIVCIPYQGAGLAFVPSCRRKNKFFRFAKTAPFQHLFYFWCDIRCAVFIAFGLGYIDRSRLHININPA